MDKIRKRLEKLTGEVLRHPDIQGDEGAALTAELSLLNDLSSTWKAYEGMTATLPNNDVKTRLDFLTGLILGLKNPTPDGIATFTAELKTLQAIIKTWNGFEKVEVTLDEDMDVKEQNRRSSKAWDLGGLTTEIKLTAKQIEAIGLLDDAERDKVLLLGGSGSGKSFIEAYKLVRDTLRYRAPCLVARDKLVDLTQGMIDQIIPAILQLIAESNGQDRWEMWTIDGLKFAKWTDKRSRIEFATGGYIRFAGLSIRDLSESGSDKILSPSWLHVMLEEVSELDYPIVEKIITRLRYNVEGVLNKLMLCENPPSINHWTYKRFYEKKKEDGSYLADRELAQMGYLLMNPRDNIENLSEKYIDNLSQMTGANKERFYDGKFQDTETGEILKRMQWTDNFPHAADWDAMLIYTDPTPLTTKDHSVYADYKASLLVGLWFGQTYVLDVRLVRGSTMDMLQSIKQLWDVSPNQAITHIWMEKKAVPSDFKQVWNVFAGLTNWSVPIKFDTRKFGEKKQAIETFLQPVFEQGNIFFNLAFKDTERGRQVEHQILKFSRKRNDFVHDDVPDALMKADTLLKGKARKLNSGNNKEYVALVRPAYIHKGG